MLLDYSFSWYLNIYSYDSMSNLAKILSRVCFCLRRLALAQFCLNTTYFCAVIGQWFKFVRANGTVTYMHTVCSYISWYVWVTRICTYHVLCPVCAINIVGNLKPLLCAWLQVMLRCVVVRAFREKLGHFIWTITHFRKYFSYCSNKRLIVSQLG